jgi:putative transposase
MPQLLDSLAVEAATTVFGHKDQMDMHSEHIMSAVSKVVDVPHGPKHPRTMLRWQAYRFEMMPNGEQIRMLRQFAGSCRFVYNKGLALNRERYTKKEKHLGYAGLCALLPAWKIEHPFLSDVPAQALQQALKNLERAYTNFFKKRADFPKFHKKGQRNGFRIPQGFAVDNANGRIKLAKLGWMRYRKSPDVLGQAANISLSESCGKWFVSIQTEREVERPRHPSQSSIGLDWGVTRFFTLSDGQYANQLDGVAAINSKRLGIASLVCSSSSGEVSPSWQKPTDSILAEARNW